MHSPAWKGRVREQIALETTGLDRPFPKLKTVSQNFCVHALERGGSSNWGKLWLTAREGDKVSGGAGSPDQAGNARADRMRFPTPDAPKPVPQGEQRQAPSENLIGARSSPVSYGPGDNLLHPLTRSSVLATPRPALAAATPDCAL